jgi:hypothetical protein
MIRSDEYSEAPGDMLGDFDQSAGEGADRRSTSSITAQVVVENDRPYPSSWVDRFTASVRRLPKPSWIFYLALGLSLSIAYLLLVLLSGAWAAGQFTLDVVMLYSFLNGMTTAYLLGLIHYLDNWAAVSLARFRPVLAVDDAGYNELQYRLTTLPVGPTLVASGLGVVYTGLWYLINTLTLPSQDMGVTPLLVNILLVTSTILIYVLVAVVVYHTIHQLLVVNEIYTRYTRINLFQPGPLYELSSLTARTAIGIGIPTYLWFQINSLYSTSIYLSDIIQTIFLGIIIIVTFVTPLLGAHRLLEREKQRLQDEVGGRIEATIATLHKRVDAGKLDDYSVLKVVLDGLVTEQGVIDKLRTWPWRTETVRGLGLAFVLPILIWFAQRILERFGL